ncbi:MAG TPA: ferredoxin [Acidothermaceae bacterium]|nr:ferredoxin [Acidothermaceae bacterium]
MTNDRARLIANPGLCDGHGICVLRAPELLTLDAWGFVGVEAAQMLSGRDLRRAASAVAACPERALSLERAHVAGGNSARLGGNSSTWTPPRRERGRRRASPGTDRSNAC